MQHWVLCELLAIARSYTRRLTFIDAHAMAPIANLRTARCGKFDAVYQYLPGQGSFYELAWQSLAPLKGTYPNSANFVIHIWGTAGISSMLLCERDEQTASSLRTWSAEHNDVETEVFPGDCRNRFEHALPKQDDLVFISFDPYMFNWHRPRGDPGYMYRCDLDRIVDATRSYSKNVLLQLSTYSTNDGNGQGQVAEFIRSRLELNGFEEVAIVKPNGRMMSLLFQRRASFCKELKSLPSRFEKWFNEIES